MNLHRYDHNKIEYIRIPKGKIYTVISLVIFLQLIFISLSFKPERVIIKEKVVEVPVLQVKDSIIVNEKLIIDEIKKYKFQYPYIVLAQIYSESGLNSRRAIETNNYLGMMVATSRLSTAKGNPGDFASYDSWKDCILDYALYHSSFIGNSKSESQVLTYLDLYYDMTPGLDYKSYLKKVINQKKLKSKFHE
jgi:hypothetical protein